MQIVKKNYRKYRNTKICNLETEQCLVRESLIDTGAKHTFLSLQTAIDLNLPFVGKYDSIHSNGVVEKTHIVYGALSIRGKIFPIPMVVSQEITTNLIIGSDFMNQYKMYLKFDTTKNDITLKKINKKIINWKSDL